MSQYSQYALYTCLPVPASILRVLLRALQSQLRTGARSGSQL